MKLMNYIIISLIFMYGFSSQIANAQNVEADECTCVTDPVETSVDELGEISLVNGNVLYSGPGGFERAPQGASLISGSQMSVGIGASANIRVGKSCDMFIPAGSEVEISQPSGAGSEICVKVSGSTASVAVTPPAAPNILPLALVGGAVGLGVALGGGDDSASN